MTKEEILGNLCHRDPKSTEYYGEQDDDDPVCPRVDCFCDNCFYGRDKLALELLKQLEEITYLQSEICSYASVLADMHKRMQATETVDKKIEGSIVVENTSKCDCCGEVVESYIEDSTLVQFSYVDDKPIDRPFRWGVHCHCGKRRGWDKKYQNKC